VCVTIDDWRTELEQLFLDLQPQAHSMNDDEETDTDERTERINQAFDKVKAVCPHMKSIDRLKATSVEDLLSHPAVSKLLSSVQKISMPKSEFSKRTLIVEALTVRTRQCGR
jgi:hypothetical protein